MYSLQASDADMRVFDAGVKGSPNHPKGRVRAAKVLGGWIGDDGECTKMFLDSLQSTAATMNEVDELRDSADNPRAAWAMYRLGRVCASVKPIFATSLMPPQVTVRPAFIFDSRMCASFDTWMRTTDTAMPERVKAARMQAFIQERHGGFGYTPVAGLRPRSAGATSPL